jgi:ATP-dependent DNA ligase
LLRDSAHHFHHAALVEDPADTLSCPEDGVMLPQVLPILAVAAKPFDSPEYCFEFKYDGVRALAAVEGSGWQLWGRERADYTTRYPELDVLRRLPTGTLVDGELVAFDADGRLASIWLPAPDVSGRSDRKRSRRYFARPTPPQLPAWHLGVSPVFGHKLILLPVSYSTLDSHLGRLNT